MKRLQLMSWIVFALSLFACGAAFYAGWYLLGEATVRAEATTSTEQRSSRAAFTERLQALAADTKVERERLEAIGHNDVIAIVTRIESVGPAANVTLRVSDALPEGAGMELPDGSHLVPIVFLVSAEGGFAALEKALGMLENIPLPASVIQVELEKGGEGAAALWRLSARIRVLTTSAISI